LSDGKDSFHPAVALFTGGTLGALSPQHAKAQDSFRVIVGGSDALFFQKEPQAGKLSFQMPGKSTCGITQGLGFVDAFDKRLPKYEHVMKDIYVGEHVTYFDGVLRVWLSDDSVVETPFWDKIEVDPTSGKITTVYALFSIAAVPEKYWKDLKTEDFAEV
jgi:hypothetical protein